MSLYDQTKQLYGTRTANKLSDFFNDMQLPMPSDGEFHQTDDKGFLVFLNKEGIVIRFTKKNEGLWNFSKRVLHPLGSRITGRLRADINPGITCPITPKQRREMIGGLHADKLDFVDEGLYNGGTLPAVANLIKEGFAVAVDPIAVHRLTSAVSLVKGWLARKFMPGTLAEAADDPQAIIYKPLKSLFNEAWQNRKQPDATIISQFWEKAREMKASGLLKASWLTPEMASRNYKNAFEGSLRYDAHRRLLTPT